MTKIVLFDIDGTLVLTGGAGLRAMNRVCRDVLGIDNALDGVSVAGRTDWIILSDALSKAGRTLDAAALDALRTPYVRLLAEEIQAAGQGPKAVMPGIGALLDHLDARDDVFLGLVTGNFREAARIKLEYFDLWGYFTCGAFGDDAADRNALVPMALARAQEHGLPGGANHDVIVVGDTPHDIACARAAGARAIAVATGTFSADALRACGADAVFDDLSDTGRVLQIFHDGR
jgi:phosphoglycolate phosphatase-like HAD superfamily hydrolase